MIPHSKPTLGIEEQEAVARVLASGMIAQGREVEAFERECADFMHKRHAVAVSSGTAALHLALMALDVQPGQPVLSPSYACHALITATRLQQAMPLLGDIDSSYNLDPESSPESAVAIVPHLFGSLARAPRATRCIEDVAQSMGGPSWQRAPISVTSFYATKLMTTGEGGMVFTDDDGMAECVRDRRDYDNRDSLAPRANYKMTDFQAAMGRAQLRKLSGFIQRRRELALLYRELLADLPLVLPGESQDVVFRYVISTDRRDALQGYLYGAGVDAKRPVHRPAHHLLGGEFPNSERAHQTCLSLPLYPSLSDADIVSVAGAIHSFFDPVRAPEPVAGQGSH